MRFKIDKEKTLKKSKLILNQGFLDKYFDLLFFLTLITIFPAFTIYNIVTNTINEENIIEHLILLFLAFAFTFILIIGRKDSRKLVKLKGENLMSNKNRIQNLIDEEKWTLSDSIDNIDYFNTKEYNNQISIIYEGEFIYVNVVTFGRGNLISSLRIFNTDALRDKLIIKLEHIGFAKIKK